MTTLSVLMPHFNHGAYVEEALTAILGQTRAPDDVIVLDDASTDGSYELLERLAAADPRIRLLRNERNLGPVPSCRRLLELATSDYVFFSAADDRVQPQFLERSLELLTRHPDAGLCATLSWLIDGDGRNLGLSRGPVVIGSPGYLSPRQARSAWRQHAFWLQGNTIVYRRDALIGVGGFRDSLKSFTDGFAVLAISLRYGACFVPEPLASWRLADGGYWQTTGADLEQAGVLHAEAARLMRGDLAEAFDEDSIRLWEERLALESRLQRQGRWPALQRAWFGIRNRLPLHRVALARLRRAKIARKQLVQ